MNYTKQDLKPIGKYHFEKPVEKLVWNDRDDIQPRKLWVTGFDASTGKWLALINLGDGADDWPFDHAADIPSDWKPYKEPTEIPFFDCKEGETYRVVGNCGMDFDRKMVCVVCDLANNKVLFGDSMNDKKLIGTAWINHVYTC